MTKSNRTKKTKADEAAVALLAPVPTFAQHLANFDEHLRVIRVAMQDLITDFIDTRKRLASAVGNFNVWRASNAIEQFAASAIAAEVAFFIHLPLCRLLLDLPFGCFWAQGDTQDSLQAEREAFANAGRVEQLVKLKEQMANVERARNLALNMRGESNFFMHATNLTAVSVAISLLPARGYTRLSGLEGRLLEMASELELASAA